MSAPPSCPRCARPLRAPGLWSSDWQCERHGAVHPFHAHKAVSAELLEQTAARAAVPLWMPLPLVPGWSVTGVAYAGDERTGARATALALGGPSPVGGPADAVVVAEEPGVGLGGRYAGLGELDPTLSTSSAPDGKVEA